MNRYLFKSLVAIVVSFVLLYYSVAWAVLRCSHDEDQSAQEVVLDNDDADIKDFHYASSNPVPLNLECVGADYHTEFMAESLSPSELHRLTLGIAPDVNGFLTYQTVSGHNVWLRAVFESLSSLSFPIGLPRYLSLSILRI